MVDDVTWSLSGVDTLRWGLQSVSMWRPPITTRRTTLEVPGRHGVISTGLPTFEEPTVSLTLWLHGSTQDDIEVAALELIGLLTAPDLTLTRTSGDLVTSAPASLVSLTPDEFTTATEATFEAVLAIPGAFLRADTATSSDVALTMSGQEVTVPDLAAGTAPTTDATLRLTGPASSVTVTDVVSSTGLSWTGTLDADEYLFIDAADLTARISTTSDDWTDGGTDVSGGLDYPGAGRLQLWPRMADTDPAARAVTVTVTGGGWDTTTALAVRAAPAYL